MVFNTTIPFYNFLDIFALANVLEKAYFKKDKTKIIEYFNNIEKSIEIPSLIETKEETKTKDNMFHYYESNETKAEVTSVVYCNTLIFLLIGSDDLIDWIYDFQLNPKKMKINNLECKIHTGFLKQYLSLKSTIFDIFNKYLLYRKSPKVLFVSHSLGILGELAAIDIKNLHPTVIIDNISFGAPRVGNYNFCHICNNTFRINIRIVNNNDIVPSFQFFNGYKHNGTVIILKKNKKISFKDRSHLTDIRYISTVFFSWMPCIRKITYFKDHELESYITRLKNLLE